MEIVLSGVASTYMTIFSMLREFTTDNTWNRAFKKSNVLSKFWIQTGLLYVWGTLGEG